jgi:DNA-binding NarL/FixJ family response regulator
VASHSAVRPALGDATRTLPRALIVDDNDQFLASARKVLALGGIDVVAVAKTDKDAVARARELRPDVALVDVDLGDESGFHVARSLAALDPPPVVILISTHPEDELAELVAASPTAGFVPKSRLDADAVRAYVD